MYQLLDKVIIQELQKIIGNYMKMQESKPLEKQNEKTIQNLKVSEQQKQQKKQNENDNDNDLMFFELKNEDKITKRQTFNKEIRSIISDKPNLKLNKQECQQIKDKKFWNFIVKSRISSLILLNCQYSHILKEIGQNHIQFTILKTLNLQGNRINSIEYLPFQKMKILQNLSLKNNQITNMNSFGKINLRCLRNLNIENNHCPSFSSKLSRANIQSRKLIQNIETYYYSFCFQIKMDYVNENYHCLLAQQDLSFAMKLSLQCLQNMQIRQFQRIYQGKLQTMFMNRFGGKIGFMNHAIEQEEDNQEQQNWH